MNDINNLKDSLDLIDSATNTSFELAQKMFFELDTTTEGKAETTTEGKLFTTIGMEIATIKIVCNKLSNQIELLEELTKEEINV